MVDLKVDGLFEGRSVFAVQHERKQLGALRLPPVKVRLGLRSLALAASAITFTLDKEWTLVSLSINTTITMDKEWTVVSL